MLRIALVLLAALAPACARAPLPLVEAPGARVVLAGADAQAALAWATRLGLTVPAGAALAIDNAAWAASVLPGGDVVVVVKDDVGAAAGFAGEPVLGAVRALTVEGHAALMRPDRGRTFWAADVAVDRRTELAAVLEAMATAEHPVVVEPPPPGLLRVRIADQLLPLGVVEITLDTKADGELLLRATAPNAKPEVVAALTAPAPKWACALDEGALAVLALPPMGPAGLDDAFTGPMLLALYPRGAEPASPSDPLPEAALVVAGVPRGAAAADEVIKLMPGSTRETRDGGRRTLEVDGARMLRVVVDEGVLAVGFGEAAPVSRIRPQAPCPSGDRPLLAGDIAALSRALPGLLPPGLALMGAAPLVARASRDGGGLALELRARLPAGVPF